MLSGMKGRDEGSAEKKKKKKKQHNKETEEDGLPDHVSKGLGLEPNMERKKKKKQKEQGKEQFTRVFQLGYGNLHNKDEGSAQGYELKMKKEAKAGDLGSLQEDEEAFAFGTARKRKREKTGKQATEVVEQNSKRLTLDDESMRIGGEVHSISDITEWKSSRTLVDFSLHHDISILAQNQKKKKKKKKKRKKDQVEQGSNHLDYGKNPVQLNDEDDMLFNFNTQPEAAVVGHKKARVSSDRKEKNIETSIAKDDKAAQTCSQDDSKTVVVEENHGRNQKKKKKTKNDQGEQESNHPDYGKDPVQLDDEDDMLFNFATQPEAVVVDHKKAHVNSDRKEQNIETLIANDDKSAQTCLQNDSKTVVVEENHRQAPNKKKKKRDGGEQDSPYLDHRTDCMLHSQDDDMAFNFIMQPEAVVKNIVEYKSPKGEINQHANGSFQQNPRLQNEVSIEQKHLKESEKKEKTQADRSTEGTLEKNRSPMKASNKPTFSIAVAGSVVDNAQSLELATMLAGQIARAAAIFRVDEIVVFDDYDGESAANHQEDDSEEIGGLFMVRILKYLEVPQYLRRALIPMHRSLSSVGKLPPLDAPHHLRKHEWRPFREGVVLDKRPLSGLGSCVDVGLEKDVLVSQSLEAGMRVTVAMGQSKADGG